MHASRSDLIDIRTIDAEDTLYLRNVVLRPGTPEAECVFEGDDAPETAHFGAFRGGVSIGIASVYQQSRPGAEGDEWRLRGMATSEAARGTGGGAAVVAAVEAYAASRGSSMIWCNARTGAVGFYERNGWTKVGDEFEIDGIGPHFVMEKALEPTEPDDDF